MRWLWAVFGAAMVGEMYYIPPQAPGESNMHYILFSDFNAGGMICAVIASACLTILFMNYVMRN